MNAIKNRIFARLESIDKSLKPLATLCKRYTRYCSAVDPSDETLMIGHQPWIAAESYALRVFPGAQKSWFAKHARIHGLKFPREYEAILASANGIQAFGLSLYGIPAFMEKETPPLSRSKPQCQDIGRANAFWKREFPEQTDSFHFGGRRYNETQTAGYFWDRQGELMSVLKTGEVVGRWIDFRDFLTEELEAAEREERAQMPEEWWQ